MQLRNGAWGTVSAQEAGEYIKSGDYCFLDVRPSSEHSKVPFCTLSRILNVSCANVKMSVGLYTRILEQLQPSVMQSCAL